MVSIYENIINLKRYQRNANHNEQSLHALRMAGIRQQQVKHNNDENVVQVHLAFTLWSEYELIKPLQNLEIYTECFTLKLHS